MTKTASPLVRCGANPVISPETLRDAGMYGYDLAFNAGVYKNGIFHAFTRADIANHDHRSVLVHAESDDGLHFHLRSERPMFDLKHPYSHGTEDSRVTIINGQVYLTMVGFDGRSADGKHLTRIMMSHSPDYNHPDEFSEPKTLVEDNKNGVLLQGEVNLGQGSGRRYALFERPSMYGVSVAYASTPMGPYGEANTIQGLQPRKDIAWDSVRLGVGCNIGTPEGWLVLYHGVDKNNVYSMGAALLKKDDPTKVLARTRKPLLTPETDYERNGWVSDVIFPSAIVPLDNASLDNAPLDTKVRIYYGAADKFVAAADSTIEEIIGTMEGTYPIEFVNGKGETEQAFQWEARYERVMRERAHWAVTWS